MARPPSPNAVVLYLPRQDGRVLAVSRGLFNPGTVGLPGGKVEDGEHLEDAIVREAYEETGVVVSGVYPIFGMTCAATKPGGRSFYTTCFVADQWRGVPKWFSMEGWVRWVQPNELLQGPFADYNAALLDHIASSKQAGR